MQESMCVLGPVTSLLLWRAAAHGVVDMPNREGRQPDLARCHARVRDVRRLDEVRALGNVPLDVIVGKKSADHRCRSMDSIVLGAPLPTGSFCSLDDGVYVCSPELLYVLLGRGADRVGLARIGCELCGSYALAHDQSGNFCNCPPITSHERIGAYLRDLGRRHGRRAAGDALAMVADRSDSPRETAMFLCLTLPAKVGGYGYRQPLLNARLEISESAQAVLQKSYLVVDELFLDEEGTPVLAAECDSRKHHLWLANERGEGTINAVKILKDDERREVIRELDVDVISLRYEDTKEFARFDAKALRIGRMLGEEPRSSQGLVRSSRMTLFQQQFDTRGCASEHRVLRSMAGYRRMISHGRGQA